MSRTLTLPFPLRGLDENYSVGTQPPLTSSSLNNVRPYDIQDKRSRGGQRPGLKKLYTQRIGGGDFKIDAMTQVTTV